MSVKWHTPRENEKLKRILDYLKIAYWLVDLDFVLLDVNRTFLELTGAKREKVIGREMLTLVNEEERINVQLLLKELTEGKRESVRFELYVYGRQPNVKHPIIFHVSIQCH
jgi:PAS domain S-box-containing protein